MNNDLINRYVYAATKRLNGKNREDISKEIYSLIDDMLLERCKGITPTDKDIRVVLTELGTPLELYQKYKNEDKQELIGGEYFITYKYILTLILGCVVMGLGAAAFVLLIITPVENPVFEALNWFGVIINTLVYIFTFITLAFAWFYKFDTFKKHNINIDNSLNLDALPPVPKVKKEFSKWEIGFEIIFTVFFLGLFLISPQILTFSFNGNNIPVFDMANIQSAWYLILVFGLVGIVRDIVKFIEKSYTKKVLIVTTIVNIISLITAFMWLLKYNLFSEQFISFTNEMFAAGDLAISLFNNFNAYFLAILIFAIALDTGTTIYKTYKDN